MRRTGTAVLVIRCFEDRFSDNYLWDVIPKLYGVMLAVVTYVLFRGWDV